MFDYEFGVIQYVGERGGTLQESFSSYYKTHENASRAFDAVCFHAEPGEHACFVQRIGPEKVKILAEMIPPRKISN